MWSPNAGIAKIREATWRELLDRRWLEDVIAEAGLAPRGREIPVCLHDHIGGVRAWQYPIQLAPYLLWLSDKRIRSYAEIGVAYGGTFILTVEYLSRFFPLTVAVAIDMSSDAAFLDYARERPWIRIVSDLSTSPAARRAAEQYGPFDLAFIDADHAEAACLADYEMISPYARIVAFHDLVEHTTPGVAKVWADVTGAEKVEFVEQYAGVADATYGIGAVEQTYA